MPIYTYFIISSPEYRHQQKKIPSLLSRAMAPAAYNEGHECPKDK